VPTTRKPAAPPAEQPLDSIADTIAALRRLKTRQAKAKAEQTKMEAIIKAALGESPAGTVAGVVAVRWSTTARLGVDVKAVKEKFPDVASACSRVTEVRTFQLVDPA
jgi:predicted phage-related endonuclease